MGKFNLGEGLLSEVSRQVENQNSFKIVHLPISQIRTNKNNKYSIEAIEELKFLILHNGLKQNLEVKRVGTDEYELVSGERRWTALNELINEGHSQFTLVPCIITDGSECDLPLSPETKEKYAISMTNFGARKYTEEDLLMEVATLKEVYSELKANGYPLSEKQREFIAEKLQISPTQVHRYDYVNKHASEPVIDAVKNSGMSINVAAEIAKLPEKEQTQLIHSTENPKDLTPTKVIQFHKKKEKQRAARSNEMVTIHRDDFLYIQDLLDKTINPLRELNKGIEISASDAMKLTAMRVKISTELEKIDKILKKYSDK